MWPWQDLRVAAQKALGRQPSPSSLLADFFKGSVKDFSNVWWNTMFHQDTSDPTTIKFQQFNLGESHQNSSKLIVLVGKSMKHSPGHFSAGCIAWRLIPISKCWRNVPDAWVLNPYINPSKFASGRRDPSPGVEPENHSENPLWSDDPGSILRIFIGIHKGFIGI